MDERMVAELVEVADQWKQHPERKVLLQGGDMIQMRAARTFLISMGVEGRAIGIPERGVYEHVVRAPIGTQNRDAGRLSGDIERVLRARKSKRGRRR